jgi:threonine dehydratase
MMHLPDLPEIEAAAQVVYRHFPGHAAVPLGTCSSRAPGHRLLAQAREPHAGGRVQDPRRPDLFRAARRQGGALPREVISATRGNHGQSVAGRRAPTAWPAPSSCRTATRSRKTPPCARWASRTGRTRRRLPGQPRTCAAAGATARRAHGAQLPPDAGAAASAPTGGNSSSACRQLDVVYVPIGLGSGVCAAIAAKLALNHPVRIVGVVSTLATTYADSLAAGQRGRSTGQHPAGRRHGLPRGRARCPGYAGGHLDHIVQVSDAEVAQAMRDLFTDTHNVAEGAGAASFAAAMQERDRLLKGQVVGTTLCGRQRRCERVRTGHFLIKTSTSQRRPVIACSVY